MTKKRITIELTDDEWKEILDSVRHQSGEPLSENEIENMVKREATKIIRDIYIYALQ